MEELKKALFTNGPCYIAVPCYNFREDMWKANPAANETTVIGGHAMTVVGYDKTGFIIRNSWGTEWGQNGYTLFPFSDWGKQYEVWTVLDDDSLKEYIDINKVAEEAGGTFIKFLMAVFIIYFIMKK